MSFLYSIALFPSHPCGRTPAPPTHENPRSTRSGLMRGSACATNLSNAMPANYNCNTNFHTSQIIPQSSMTSKSQLTIHTRFERHFCDAESQQIPRMPKLDSAPFCHTAVQREQQSPKDQQLEHLRTLSDRRRNHQKHRN